MLMALLRLAAFRPFHRFRDGWRTAIAVVVLVCSGITAWWLILYGRPENLLHQSALSWSFTLIAVILAAFVLGHGRSHPTHRRIRRKSKAESGVIESVGRWTLDRQLKRRLIRSEWHSSRSYGAAIHTFEGVERYVGAGWVWLVTRSVTGPTFTLDNVPIEGVPSNRLRRHRKASRPPHKLIGTHLSCPPVRLEASRAKGHSRQCGRGKNDIQILEGSNCFLTG
jgi:hypothetical protein